VADRGRLRPFDPDREAARLGIDEIEYWPMERFLGMYATDGMRKQIALAEHLALREHARLRRVVLAHELGHANLHRGVLVAPLACACDQVALVRAELAAERWAGERLCPPTVIKSAMERWGAIDREETAELADQLQVPEDWLTWWMGDLRRRRILTDPWGRGLHQEWVPRQPGGRFGPIVDARAAGEEP